MSRALGDVRGRFPDLAIRLAAISDEDGPDAVHRDQPDLAIVSRYGHAREAARPGLREWVLGHDPLRLCVPPDHPLAGASECAMSQLAGEPWVMCPDTSLGQLVRGMCVAAGFQPRVAATVQDVGTAISLVGIGWGITIAPELTPSGTDGPVVRLPITGVVAIRYTVLIARDGEHRPLGQRRTAGGRPVNRMSEGSGRDRHLATALEPADDPGAAGAEDREDLRRPAVAAETGLFERLGQPAQRVGVDLVHLGVLAAA